MGKLTQVQFETGDIFKEIWYGNLYIPSETLSGKMKVTHCMQELCGLFASQGMSIIFNDVLSAY